MDTYSQTSTGSSTTSTGYYTATVVNQSDDDSNLPTSPTIRRHHYRYDTDIEEKEEEEEEKEEDDVYFDTYSTTTTPILTTMMMMMRDTSSSTTVAQIATHRRYDHHHHHPVIVVSDDDDDEENEFNDNDDFYDNDDFDDDNDDDDDDYKDCDENDYISINSDINVNNDRITTTLHDDNNYGHEYNNSEFHDTTTSCCVENDITTNVDHTTTTNNQEYFDCDHDDNDDFVMIPLLPSPPSPSSLYNDTDSDTFLSTMATNQHHHLHHHDDNNTDDESTHYASICPTIASSSSSSLSSTISSSSDLYHSCGGNLSTSTTTDTIHWCNNPLPPPPSQPQSRVRIIGGTHIGRMGYFIQRTSKCMAIRIDTIPTIRYLQIHNVEFIFESSSLSSRYSNNNNHNHNDANNHDSRAVPTTTTSTSTASRHETTDRCGSNRVPQTPPSPSEILHTRRQNRTRTDTAATTTTTPNTTVVMDDDDDDGLEVGRMVEIIGGSYRGQMGQIYKITCQRVAVRLIPRGSNHNDNNDDDDVRLHYLHPHNVQQQQQPSPIIIRTEGQDNNVIHPQSIPPGESSSIVQPISSLQQQHSIPYPSRTTATSTTIHIPSTTARRNTTRTGTRQPQPQPQPQHNNNSSRMNRTIVMDSGGIDNTDRDAVDATTSSDVPLMYHRFGDHNLRTDSIQLVGNGELTHCETTLAHSLFPNRPVQLYMLNFTKHMRGNIPTYLFNNYGSKFELLTAKMLRSKQVCGPPTKKVQAVYVLTDGGPHLQIESINLQTELNRVANFGQLSVEKVTARLQLLQSTAAVVQRSSTKKQPLVFDNVLSIDDIEEIDENAHEGCGFMPMNFAKRFYGTSKVGQRIFALQVRIIIPQLGIYKGMLVVKDGIDRIQLPTSMKKVGPSTIIDTNDQRVFLLINDSFPSKINAIQFPKLFRNLPLCKSFAPKRLNDMIQRIWQDWPIPTEVIHRYVENSSTKDGTGHVELHHTCLVGLSDPTDGGIPAGTVFITGRTDTPIDETVFISRYPCTEATTDAHLVSVLQDRPSQMSISTWQWLNSLHFGGIIFGNPTASDGDNDTQPLPCRIANGDLDGDLYFVCWDEEILHHSKSVRTVGIPQQLSPSSTGGAVPVAASSGLSVTYNENWLRQGQERMSESFDTIDLVSQLYRLWKKRHNCCGHTTSTASRNINHNNNNRSDDDDDVIPDHVYFGRAYKAALDIGKHGGLVYLPLHCWEAVPSLHSMLQHTHM